MRHDVRDPEALAWLLQILRAATTPMGARSIARAFDHDAWRTDERQAFKLTSQRLYELRRRGLCRKWKADKRLWWAAVTPTATSAASEGAA